MSAWSSGASAAIIRSSCPLGRARAPVRCALDHERGRAAVLAAPPAGGPARRRSLRSRRVTLCSAGPDHGIALGPIGGVPFHRAGPPPALRADPSSRVVATGRCRAPGTPRNGPPRLTERGQEPREACEWLPVPLRVAAALSVALRGSAAAATTGGTLGPISPEISRRLGSVGKGLGRRMTRRGGTMLGSILVIIGLVGLAILLEWPVIWLILAFVAVLWLWQALRPTPRP